MYPLPQNKYDNNLYTMKSKLMYNTVTSLLLQVVTVICGFITPRLFLSEYGSDVNGLVQSVTQFLGVISFLELGVGQVIQSALYKPLAKSDSNSVDCVLASGGKFFRRIAYILLAYIAVLVCVYPYLSGNNFDWMYSATLIIAIGIGSFAQYYFGIIDRILLNADQRGYIQYTAQIITLILNTIACVILINMGASVQLVKLVSSALFLLRPFVLRLYINKRYSINRRVKYTEEPIKQKWNGIAQHVSAFILNGTDNIVLTLFSTLSNVSIYSVYHLVVYGVHQVFQSATAGLHSMVGNLWAKQEIKKLNHVYGIIETVLHLSTVFLFTCTGVLLTPFIRVYTNGVSDANYIQPLFAVLIVIAHAMQCIKTTYNILILSAGHYKQVQSCHIITAAINLVSSIILVQFWGLVGVAVGTLLSMTYQAVWMAWYNSRNILKWPFKNFIKQIVLDIIASVVIYFSTSWIQLGSISYFSLFLLALQVLVIAALITVAIAFLFYRKRLLSILKKKIIFDYT